MAAAVVVAALISPPTRPLVGSPFVGGGCCVEFCEQVGDVVAAKVAAHVDGGALAVGGGDW